MSAAHPILTWYRHIQLNAAQIEKLKAALAQAGETRPTLAKYERVKKEIGRVMAPKNTTSIPGTTKIPRDAVNPWPAPLVLINGMANIPEGLALFPLADSAGTHSVLNAGETAWTAIWNYWRNLGEKGRQQLIANSQRT